MAGSGGGGPFTHRSPEALARLVKSTEDETAIKDFETELGGFLNELLSSANSRNVELVRDRLEKIKSSMSGPLERALDTLFGGSVAKHTYVDGLSDVDCLLVLNDTSLEGSKPSEALAKVANLVAEAVGSEATVSTGRLAVTVQYRDGMQIQLLPAFRRGDLLRVPSFSSDAWSGISPEAFQNALSSQNAACGGKLVPTIKLAKAVIGSLPEDQRLSGYHIESLAIAAFREYSGPKTTAAMLPVFFEQARELVLRPIQDRTGQSVNVDDYLGPANSADRVAASHLLARIGKRMRNASAHMSKDQWEALFQADND